MKRKLGKMERAQVLSNDVYSFNVVVVLKFDRGPLLQTVSQLLPELPKRHPILGVHLNQEERVPSFTPDKTFPIPLQQIIRLDDLHWQRQVESELMRPFDLSKGPLIRFTVLHREQEDQAAEILIILQHAACDAAFLSGLLEELLHDWAELENPGQIPLEQSPQPSQLQESTERLFPASARGFRSLLPFLWFILRQIGDEFFFLWSNRKNSTGVNGRQKQRIPQNGTNHILNMKLDRLFSSDLLRQCRRRRISIHSLLTAAMLLAFARHRYPGQKIALRTITTADLRPLLRTTLDRYQGGSYFSMLRLSLTLDENAELWQLAEQIGCKMHQALKRGDHFRANRLSLAMMRMLFRFRSFRMAHTACSYSGPLGIKKKYGPLRLRDLHAFVSNFVLGPEFSALSRIWEGELYWDMVTLEGDMNREETLALAEEIRSILEVARVDKEKDT